MQANSRSQNKIVNEASESSESVINLDKNITYNITYNITFSKEILADFKQMNEALYNKNKQDKQDAHVKNDNDLQGEMASM